MLRNQFSLLPYNTKIMTTAGIAPFSQFPWIIYRQNIQMVCNPNKYSFMMKLKNKLASGTLNVATIVTIYL